MRELKESMRELQETMRELQESTRELKESFVNNTKLLMLIGLWEVNGQLETTTEAVIVWKPNSTSLGSGCHLWLL